MPAGLIHYALINSGLPVRNGISVNTPTGGGVGGANYILDDGYAQKSANLDQQTKVTNTRYINGGSSEWEKTNG